MATDIDIDMSILPDLQTGDTHTYSCLTRNPYRLWTIKPCGSDAWYVKLDDITNDCWSESRGGFTPLGIATALHMWGLVGPVKWKARIASEESI